MDHQQAQAIIPLHERRAYKKRMGWVGA